MARKALNARFRRTPLRVRRGGAVAALAAFACLLEAGAQPPSEDDPEPSRGSETPLTEPDASQAPDGTQTAPALEAPERIVTRLEAQIAYQTSFEEERYAEAARAGERMLELTIEEFGPMSREAAEAHADLGEAQSRAGEHQAAERNLLRAVEILREREGMFEAPVIDPLIGLGDNYQRADQYLNAVSAYNEARTVSRRVFGLLNEGQIEILDKMTATFQSMDDYLQADEQQLEALRLVERNHPPHSPEMLEAIYKYAAWLRESGRYHEEREQYARAARIIRERYGDEDPRLARPLRETGNSYRTQRSPEGQGISSLNDALEILENDPDGDPRAMAEVLRDIGDWEVAFSRTAPDLDPYRRSWELLEQVEDGEALREAWYSGLEYVLREPISQRGLSNDPEALSGHVLVRFDLSAHGRTENEALVESDPPGMKDDAVMSHVRMSRFRPNMEDGALVRTENRALRFNFRYLPPDEEDD